MRRLITPEVSRRVLEMHTAGSTLREMSEATGFTPSSLSKLLRRLKVPPGKTGPRLQRGSSLSPDEERLIVRLYQERECSLRELARRFSITAGAVRTVLRRAGHATRRLWSPRRQPSGGVQCIDCGEVLTENNAIRDKSRLTEYISRCDSCQLAYTRLKKYGLTVAEMGRRLEEQANGCAICRGALTIASLVVDHCHTGGHVRGLLCSACNKALGLLQDRAECLNHAAVYLESADTGLIVQRTGVYTAPGTVADKHRYYIYGVTPAQYQALVQRQGGVCAICHQVRSTKRAPALIVEHCHRTLRVRGLTCQFCNLALSALRDDPAVCRAAAAYLTRTRHGAD